MFKGFKPQGLQKIASRMGYAGRMEEFDSYLQQNPDKQREMITYQEKAQEMARGGSVVKMANGGITNTQFIPPQMAAVGSGVSDGLIKTMAIGEDDGTMGGGFDKTMAIGEDGGQVPFPIAKTMAVGEDGELSLIHI